MDLTGYIEQLRAFLPKSEQHGGPLIGEGGVVKGVGPLAQLDQTLVKAWDKMSAKVSEKQ